MRRILTRHGAPLALADRDRIADTGDHIAHIGAERLKGSVSLLFLFTGSRQGDLENSIAVLLIPVDDV